MSRSRLLTFRVLYLLAIPCGEAAAYLATVFRSLRASDRVGLTTTLLGTTVVLGAWLPPRLLFLIFVRGCEAVAPLSAKRP